MQNAGRQTRDGGAFAGMLRWSTDSAKEITRGGPVSISNGFKFGASEPGCENTTAKNGWSTKNVASWQTGLACVTGVTFRLWQHPWGSLELPELSGAFDGFECSSQHPSS